MYKQEKKFNHFPSAKLLMLQLLAYKSRYPKLNTHSQLLLKSSCKSILRLFLVFSNNKAGFWVYFHCENLYGKENFIKLLKFIYRFLFNSFLCVSQQKVKVKGFTFFFCVLWIFIFTISCLCAVMLTTQGNPNKKILIFISFIL